MSVGELLAIHMRVLSGGAFTPDSVYRLVSFRLVAGEGCYGFRRGTVPRLFSQ